MAEMDNTNQLLNLIGGNLSGSLTTSDKLAGLSALMRSVTRGGRAAGLTPEAAISQLQQQKIAEVQNRMQVQQLRAQAEQEAKLKVAKDAYIASLPTQQQRDEAALLPLSAFQGILQKKFESQFDKKEPTYSSTARQLIEAGVPEGSPVFRAAMRQQLGRETAIATAEGTRIIPGIDVQALMTAPKIRQTINGVNYVNINGDWYAESGAQ